MSIFGLHREKHEEGGETLYDWQLHNLYSSPDSLFSGDQMEYNGTDLLYIMHSGCGEITLLFSSVNLEGRHIFGACVLLQVECDVETACLRQSFSRGITYVR